MHSLKEVLYMFLVHRYGIFTAFFAYFVCVRVYVHTHTCMYMCVRVSALEWQSEDTDIMTGQAEDVRTALCCHTWVCRMKHQPVRLIGRPLYSLLQVHLGLHCGPSDEFGCGISHLWYYSRAGFDLGIEVFRSKLLA